MYFVANKGNSLYVRSMRLVTSLELIFERLEEQRRERLRQLKTGVATNYSRRLTEEGLVGFIRTWGGPVIYKMTPDKDEPPIRITRKELIELAQEWEDNQ